MGPIATPSDIGGLMISRLARHVIATAGMVGALGTAPGISSSQSAEPVDEKDRIAAEIVAAQSQDGARSPALIELLTELGAIYETEGQYALATAALEQARALVRANYGLHTLDQVPLMQQALTNARALGNFALVRALQEELLDLATRNPADLRAAAIHRDAGARQLDVLRRFLAGEAPTEVYTEGGIYSFLRDDMIRWLISDAQIHYADAAAVILRNRLYASEELRDIERQIVRASDVMRQRGRTGTRSRSTTIAAAPVTMQGNNTFSRVSNNRLGREQSRMYYDPLLDERMATLTELASRGGLQGAPDVLRDAPAGLSGDGRTNGYEVGRDSHRRLIAYDETAFGDSADEGALRSRLEAYVQLADWDLLYSQNGVAFDQYARLHGLLASTNVGGALIAELFAPPLPIVLPTFLPNPLETPEGSSYVDVSFEITKFGESRRIEVVGKSPGVSSSAQDEVVNVIKNARFRPRAVGGELGRPSPVAVRYYLGDNG